MLKYNEKKIGNLNLIGTFLVLMLIAFFVIMLSVNSKLDDFQKLQSSVKTKFLEDKKNVIKYKLSNINTLIDKYNLLNSKDSKIFIKDFVNQINKNDRNIIKINDLSKSMPYYEELVQNGQYLRIRTQKDENTQIDIVSGEYFVLNKNLNWVLSTKFNDNMIKEELLSWEKHLLTLIKDNIYVHISLLFLFAIALLLVMYIINRFANKTISKCRDNIKEREKVLKNEIITLQTKVEEETNKFKKQAKIVSKQTKMLALADMLGNLSHQWQQPLNAISENSNDIKSKLEKNTTIKESEILQLTNIHNSSEYLMKIIEDFRIFIKADSLKIDFVVNEIINKALSLNDVTIKKNNIKIVKDFDEDKLTYNLSFGLLQAMVNIISNAKDVLKLVPEEDRYIFLSSKNHNNGIEITITDTGNGISKGVIGSIFEPYFTTKQKTYGTGLGLHMVYNVIAQNMSGKLSVINKEIVYNKKIYTGASFSIFLYDDEIKKD